MDDRGGGAAGIPEDNVSNQDRPEDATVLFNQRFSLGVMEAPRAIAVKVPYYLCNLPQTECAIPNDHDCA